LKALVLEEYHKLVYKDVPEPEIQSNEVLVKVYACGICGSDVHGMDGSSGRRIPPIIMGHEAAGIITKIGKGVRGWQVGDRVTFDSTIYPIDDWFTMRGMYNLSDNRMVLGVSCDDYRRHGAFAEYVAAPQHILYKIPDKVTFNQAAMVEPMAVAIHAIELTPVAINDTAVVVGAGIIGLFIIQVLKIKGYGQIIAVELQPERLKLAKDLGATETLNSIDCDVVEQVHKWTENRGADIAFEAVGITSTVKLAIDCVRRGATVTLVGNLMRSIDLPLQAVVTRQLRLQGSCAICGEYPTALSLIEQGRINVDKILSVTAPLSQGAQWFKRLYNKEKGLLKVILNPC
jgi:L-iditol 2-dehydrogenase